jgi:hypothetical protein
VTPYRAAIAGRYVGDAAGERFAQTRTTPEVLVRLRGKPHRWDLRGLLEKA